MAAVKGQPAPKPGGVPKPVPGDADQAAADAFLASFDAPQVPASAQAAEASATSPQLQDSEDQYAPIAVEEAPPEPPGAGAQALDAAGRALDYAGGFVRSGLANAAGLATGKGNIVTEEDLALAAKGKAPDSAEYLRRLGVPEGGSIDIGGHKFTTRGASGFALDIATDPLTLITKAIKGAPYLKKLINAESTTGVANKAVEALGEAVYKSALPKGAEAAGEQLVKSGAPIGGAAKLGQKVEELSNTMGKLRQGLYDRATELGVSIDTAFPLKRAEAALASMRRDPGLAPAVQELEGLLARYKSAGKVPVDIVSEWKSNLYDALPASAFNGAKLKGKAKMFKSALAADFRQAIVDAGNKAEKGLGDSINSINDKWGTLLSAVRPLEKATQATGGKLGLMIDGAVAAGGGPQAYALKKGFDVATGTTARTLVGKALMEAGKKDLASRLMRQGIAAQTRTPGAPAPEEEEQ